MMSYDDSRIAEMDEILNFLLQMAQKDYLDHGDVPQQFGGENLLYHEEW